MEMWIIKNWGTSLGDHYFFWSPWTSHFSSPRHCSPLRTSPWLSDWVLQRLWASVRRQSRWHLQRQATKKTRGPLLSHWNTGCLMTGSLFHGFMKWSQKKNCVGFVIPKKYPKQRLRPFFHCSNMQLPPRSGFSLRNLILTEAIFFSFA